MDPLIAFDSGHGGNNMGTCHGGLVEKVITLELGLELDACLPHWRTLLVRTADRAMSFRDRGAMTVNAGLVICIHVDASHLERRHGMSAYYWPGNEIGKEVAQAILDAAPRALRGHGVPIEAHNDPNTAADDWIERPRNVMGAHRPTAVLAECGFASNPKDRAFLLSRAGRSAVVTALRAGVCRYLELTV